MEIDSSTASPGHRLKGAERNIPPENDVRRDSSQCLEDTLLELLPQMML